MKITDYYEPVEIGSKIVLINPTNSFSSGTTLEVIEFLDGDPNKIIVKGLLPGGWIKTNSVKRIMKKLRNKTLLEIIIDSPHPVDDYYSLEGAYMAQYLKSIPLDQNKAGFANFNSHSNSYIGYQFNGNSVKLYHKNLEFQSKPIYSSPNVKFRYSDSTSLTMGLKDQELELNLLIELTKRIKESFNWEGSQIVNEKMCQLLTDGIVYNGKIKSGTEAYKVSVRMDYRNFDLIVEDKVIIPGKQMTIIVPSTKV